MSACEILNPPPEDCVTHRSVFLFDIDNTLYRKSTGIGDLMQTYIREYIERRLNLDPADADRLQKMYYSEYGLAIEGLVRRNHVDAMEYNEEVDDALPLEKFLKPDPRLHAMLSKIDRRKYKLWLCTNAYRNHGIRVVKLLGISEFFEGITFCDYAARPLICKPMPQFFLTTMKDLGIVYENSGDSDEGGRPDRPIYFVDDSAQNVEAAEKHGWKAVHIDEPDYPEEPEEMMAEPLLPPLQPGNLPQIKYVHQLPLVFPEVFEEGR